MSEHLFLKAIYVVKYNSKLLRESPSLVNGVRLMARKKLRIITMLRCSFGSMMGYYWIDWDTSSSRGSWVRIPPPACIPYYLNVSFSKSKLEFFILLTSRH